MAELKDRGRVDFLRKFGISRVVFIPFFIALHGVLECVCVEFWGSSGLAKMLILL